MDLIGHRSGSSGRRRGAWPDLGTVAAARGTVLGHARGDDDGRNCCCCSAATLGYAAAAQRLAAAPVLPATNTTTTTFGLRWTAFTC